MLTAILLVAILWGIILLDHFTRLRKFKWLNQFDGPTPTLPIVGNALQFLGHPSRGSEVFLSNFKKFGMTFRFWEMNKPFLVCADPQLVKIVLNSKQHLQKSNVYESIVKPIMRNGLISSDADLWKSDRKILNNVFNLDYFESSFKLSISNWPALEKAIKSSVSTPTDCQKIFTDYFLIILLKSFNPNSSLVTEHFLRNIEETAALGMNIANVQIMRPWIRIPLYWKLSGYKKNLETFHKDASHIISKIVDDCCLGVENLGLANEHKIDDDDLTLNNNLGNRLHKTFKHLLRDTSKSKDWKNDHLINFIGAGVDTVSIAATMTLFFLALNPECQKKAHEEMDGLFSENQDEHLNFRDISKMRYLRMCIKEAIRLHPPVPLLGRTITEDILMDDGRHIPAGASIVFVLQGFSLNPELFPDPYRFDPERFSESNYASINPLAYIPFSTGPRNCIGQKYAESILPPMLAQVLSKYKVTTLQKAEDIKVLFEVAGTPYPKVQLIFERRSLE